MTQASERAACGGDTEDKLSSLPGDVVHHILEILPVKDAARTCILSKKWRYRWAELPNLLLDKHFCSELAKKAHYVFNDTVDRILLHHIGDIVKFDLDVSGINLSSNTHIITHIDSWLLYVTRNGVKRLALIMPNDSIYKIPSCLLNCHALMHLELANCVFKPPSASLNFPNLTILYLEKISFVLTSGDLVIKGQFLSILTLKYCIGTQHLNFVSPQLNWLEVCLNDFDLGLSCFMNCKNMEILQLEVVNAIHVERLTLEKLLCSLPMLKVLTMRSHFLEFLGAVIIPNELPFTLDYLRHLRLDVNFREVAQVSCVLELIKGSPNLTKLEIWVVSSSGDGGEAVLSYLDMPASLDRPLNNIKNVAVRIFKGSEMELAFVKLLLDHTPVLMRMSIEEYSKSFSKFEKNVMSSLMQFRRASPKAELFYFPSSN